MSFASFRTLLLSNTTNRHAVIRNGFWRAFALGFNKVIRLVVVLAAARWLGPAAFGQYNYIISLMTLAFLFSDWGINILLVRDVQQKPDEQKIFSTAFTAKALLTFVSAIAGLVIAYAAEGSLSRIALVIIVTMILANLRELYTNIIIAKQRGEFEALIAIIEGVASIALAWFILHVHATAFGFAAVNAATVVIAFIACALITRRYLAVHLQKVPWQEVKTLLINGLPLALFGIIGYIFFSADQLFIKHYFGVTEVGYYSLATRLIFAAQLVPALVVSVLFPVLSRLTANKERLRYMFTRVTAALVGLGALAALAIIVCKQLLLIAAPAYEPALPVVFALSSILIFMFPSVWLDNVLIALNKQKQDFYLTLGAAILNLLLNFLLIPIFGIVGAAYASIISQAVNTLATYWYAHRVISRIVA